MEESQNLNAKILFNTTLEGCAMDAKNAKENAGT
jgi:hypothetical protein